MKAFLKKDKLFFATTILIILICVGFVIRFSGFNHEKQKIISILVNVFMVTVMLFLVADTIKFLLLAIDEAFWPRKLSAFTTDSEAKLHTRTDYLKMRLNSLRYRLLVTEDHRNEKLNLRYQNIAHDLWLYGKYFFLLMCLVLVTQDELLYFNSNVLNDFFMNNHTYTMGLKHVNRLDQLYPFIEISLVKAFETNATNIGNLNILYGDHTSMLGVVRLRQLRRKENSHTGWKPVEFSSLDYKPKWKLPYERISYTDKYWRIYEPWLPISPTYSRTDKFFFNYNYPGYLQSYPEMEGYVTLLSNSYDNSMRVIEYLQEKHWLTWKTTAVFMDFTLFNADANIFTICTLLVEQTPFGTILSNARIISAKLHFVAQLGKGGLIVLIIYIIVVIQFFKALVMVIWYEPIKLRSMWTKLDLIIFVLNITVIILVSVQEFMVSQLLAKVESSSKLEFLDFRMPTRLHEWTRNMLGFLVCLTTMRLWRVLQFASVFQLFASTLYSAWQALASTAMIILTFLVGFGIAVVTINGNNADSFSQLFKSIISSLCFSFGFSSQITPNDLFYGGRLLGLVLYLILAFFVALLMTNLFVSIINDYFSRAKRMRDEKHEENINFLQFLRVEYAAIFKFFQRMAIFKMAYKRHNRTVAENIKRILDHKVKLKASEKSESIKHAEYKRRIERLFTVAAIMQTQMELLDHMLFEAENV
ncbi:polycystic kidney disease 2-like 2 protein [Drosophila grimshawi]|uniref:polycystic kidney disease 2-like 2 protein n=1 Tax=Drosophila grimshawi TaxID=7222 RepID=UPI001C933C5A|nr:polycystic kidney disease 2-like 2 protein [Drosophila grimshawi]